MLSWFYSWEIWEVYSHSKLNPGIYIRVRICWAWHHWLFFDLPLIEGSHEDLSCICLLIWLFPKSLVCPQLDFGLQFKHLPPDGMNSLLKEQNKPELTKCWPVFKNYLPIHNKGYQRLCRWCLLCSLSSTSLTQHYSLYTAVFCPKRISNLLTAFDLSFKKAFLLFSLDLFLICVWVCAHDWRCPWYQMTLEQELRTL